MKIRIIAYILLISLTGLSQERIRFAEIRPPNQTISPTISRLQKLNADSLSSELNLLWTKIEKEGLPLIERDSLYDDYLYMTFVYRDRAENKEISFEVFGIYDEYRFGDMKMHRLKDTDLFYRSYMIPEDICFSYRFVLNDTIKKEKQMITDPFNTSLIPTGERKSFSWSVLDLRRSEPDWNMKRCENTGSRIDTFVFNSKILSNSRNVYIYLPPGYNKQQKTKYPTVYLFDSFIYLNRVEVPNILDNLIKEGEIEPMIAVMIDNPTSTSRLTELPLNFRFKEFIIDEFVPFIHEKYGTSLNPAENIIGGISYGGLAAMFIAYFHPDVFGGVLSQSGSYWRDLDLNDSNGIEYRADWLINKFRVEEKKNLKLFLDWGLQENWCLSSGRRMVRVLDKKGYDYKFIEFNGWHDWSNSRKTFPFGLLYLIKKNEK